jgi:protein TonB
VVELPDGSVIARPIHVQPPAYPAEAYENGIEGWVRVEGTIGADGQIVDAAVVDSSPREIFDEAALSAFRAWRYCRPSDDSGQPIRIEHQLRFQMGSSGSSGPS